MNFEELYDNIRDGKLSKEEARKQVSLAYVETAKKSIVDTNRATRTGIPEIIYGEYKTYDQIIDISASILAHEQRVVISRYHDNKAIHGHFSAKYPVEYHKRISVIGKMPKAEKSILVVSGGAADHALAMEVTIMLKTLGINPLLYEDRGIAHPTRVLEAIKDGMEHKVKAVIVIAGMEGALATFVSSMVPVPVIGVPSSVGYGYKAEESALLSMLSTCTPNLAVVNIDGGIRAAVIASLIAKN
jgi:hypothetical protein